MQARSIEAIVAGLNQAGVCCLVVVGVAVAAHGFLRFTADIAGLDAPGESKGNPNGR